MARSVSSDVEDADNGNDNVEKANTDDDSVDETIKDLQNLRPEDKHNDESIVETDDEGTKRDDSDQIEENHKSEDEEKIDASEKLNDCEKDCTESADKGDGDLTNGQNENEDEADNQLGTADLSCPGSPALTDNLDNDLLDDMDHQNNLTDNSFENISSPDMFDDMSKNGFDKAQEHIVTLSSENADPDLV